MGRIFKFSSLTLGIAFVYWASALLGKSLTAPPIFATAVWPPAGISLACCLVLGKRVLPGIWLGALLANARFSWLEPLPFDELLLAGGIAVGASLQAGLVAGWVCRCRNLLDYFQNDRAIVKLLMAAGPLGSIINASWGNSLLLWMDKAQLQDLPLNWSTWWVGDSIGGLIFTPLTLIAIAKPRSVWQPMFRTVAVPLILSFVLVMGLFTYASKVERQRRLNDFNHLAEITLSTLKTNLKDFENAMISLKGLFDASERVSCSEFQGFAKNLLQNNSYIQALEWGFPVRTEEKSNYEHRQWDCGQGRIIIKERQAGSAKLIPALSRDLYFPVTYLEPFAGNQKALGFDLFSESHRKEALLLARDSNNIRASRLVQLVQEDQPRASVIVFVPVYEKQADLSTQKGREAAFLGAVMGVLNLDSMVSHALDKGLGSQRQSVRLLIKDQSTRETVYQDADFNANEGLISTQELGLAGRAFQIILNGSESSFGGSWSIWFVLAGGMSLSGLLGGFLLLLAGRTNNMENLVAQRTADLAQSNHRLTKEIAVRLKMEQEAKQLALVAEKSTSGIIITNALGKIEWANRAFTALTGFEFSEVVGQSPGKLLQGPETDPELVSYMDQCIKQGQGFDVEILNYTKSKQPIWLHLKVDPVFDAAGQLSQYIGVETNISERKAGELALYRAMLTADKANQAKSEFLANMSHEIRTPMNGVLGMLELLKDTKLTPEQLELAELSSQSANSLMGIIDDILDFSKIEAGKLSIFLAPLELRELCENVCVLMSIPAHAKGLQFTCIIAPEIHGQYQGDSTRIRQILINLLSNAVKFTQHGQVMLTVETNGKEIWFEVTDTGIGIPADEISRLFKPFEQAEQGPARRFGGTGLGLSITKSLVELMGGEINVTSKPNEGSRFRFKLTLEQLREPVDAPLPSISPPETLKDQVPALPQFPHHSVLLVEDNPVNQRVALKMLAKFGVPVRLAQSGDEALAELEENSFDLVFMDCQIPVMDGYAVTQAFRAREAGMNLGRTPVVALTAHAITGDREKSLAAGMDDHLTKPLNLDDLRLALEKWLVQPKTGQAPKIYWDYAECLEKLGGDVALLDEMRGLFYLEAPKQMQLIREGQTAKAIASSAHSLRGMAGNFQMGEVVKLCAEIEAKARMDFIDSQDPLIAELEQALSSLILAMQEA